MNAHATGNGNMDAGGGGMGQGTSQNKWTPGNDGVRITVIDTESGAAVSTPVDFSNRAQSGNVLHFGSVSKLEYLNGASLQAPVRNRLQLHPARHPHAHHRQRHGPQQH